MHLSIQDQVIKCIWKVFRNIFLVTFQKFACILQFESKLEIFGSKRDYGYDKLFSGYIEVID